MTTERMKKAIAFCDKWLYLEGKTFKGDINDFKQVSAYLGKHLEDAKGYAEAAAINHQMFIDHFYD